MTTERITEKLVREYEIEKAKRIFDITIEFNNNYKSNINNIKLMLEENKNKEQKK